MLFFPSSAACFIFMHLSEVKESALCSNTNTTSNLTRDWIRRLLMTPKMSKMSVRERTDCIPNTLYITVCVVLWATEVLKSMFSFQTSHTSTPVFVWAIHPPQPPPSVHLLALTSSFAPVIITTTTRGRHFTINVRICLHRRRLTLFFPAVTGTTGLRGATSHTANTVDLCWHHNRASGLLTEY